jgi:hypothetical protein
MTEANAIPKPKAKPLNLLIAAVRHGLGIGKIYGGIQRSTQEELPIWLKARSSAQ